MTVNTMMIELPETVGVAFEVLADQFGVDHDRIVRLKAAGYDPKKVQQCVNDLIALCKKYSK